MTIDPDTSAILRVVAFGLFALVLVRVLRHGTPGVTVAAAVSAGALLMLGVVAFAGIVQALGVPVPAGFLTTLYTFAALLAAIIGGYYVFRRGGP